MRDKTKKQWTFRARNLIKGELARRGLNYDDLAAKLKQIGVIDSPDNLRTKINRGTFSAAFMLQTLEAIGCKSVDVKVE